MVQKTEQNIGNATLALFVDDANRALKVDEVFRMSLCKVVSNKDECAGP